MFRKVNVPILGIVENMSYYQCPSCGHQDHIFGEAGAKQTAAEMGIELLGEVCSTLLLAELLVVQPVELSWPACRCHCSRKSGSRQMQACRW